MRNRWRGSAVVTAHHRDLHDTHARRLVERQPNRTFYQYGYLFMADTLCYWQREILQMRAILGTGAIALRSRMRAGCRWRSMRAILGTGAIAPPACLL